MSPPSSLVDALSTLRTASSPVKCPERKIQAQRKDTR